MSDTSHRIEAQVLSGGRILQEVQVNVSGTYETVSQSIVFTESDQVIAAMVELGWIAPVINK